MTVTEVTGLPGRARTSGPVRAGALPLAFSRCTRVVAVTVRLPEFLLAAAGTVQRLDAAGVPIDLLELAWQHSSAERAATAALDRLEACGLTRHRLALPTPFGVERTGDVLAALSELIGFDPESGLVCLVPGSGEPNRSAFQAVEAATATITGAYRLKVVRYAPEVEARTAEIDLDDDEWRRKCDGLAACAPDVAPLSGRREYVSG